MPRRSSLVAVVNSIEAPARPADFVKVEKNLNTLGFFSPAKSRAKVRPTEKVIHFRKEVHTGKTVEAQATILPSAKYGLPTTADLDKYLAFQKLVGEIRLRDGQVSNPVGFTSTQMLSVLGIKDAGNNYQDIHDWLQRMTLTGINSKGVVYFSRRKAWVSDTFHVFDRVIALGAQMPDGSVADRNYVWLSDWQLENVNSNYVLPIDFDTYRQLRNHIAKVLVPLLQLWLYASRSEGRFEKKYGDLCEILNITRHQPLSLIRRQLEPSLAELQRHEYLAEFRIESTADGRDYKLVATHGAKFYRDQRIRAVLPSTEPPRQRTEEESELLAELINRGVVESQARRLLRSIPVDRPVLEQLEYADHLIERGRGAIANPPGFYLYILRQNIRPPAGFESARERRRKAAASSLPGDGSALSRRQELDYEQHCRAQVARHLEAMPAAEREARLAEQLAELRRKWRRLPPATLREMAEATLLRSLRETLPLPTWEQFVQRGPQASLFD